MMWGTLGLHGELCIEACYCVYKQCGHTLASIEHNGETAANSMTNQRVFQESQKIKKQFVDHTSRVFKNLAAREEN